MSIQQTTPRIRKGTQGRIVNVDGRAATAFFDGARAFSNVCIDPTRSSSSCWTMGQVGREVRGVEGQQAQSPCATSSRIRGKGPQSN